MSDASQLSYAWPEPEKVPRRARLARQSLDAMPPPEMLFPDKIERRNRRYHDDVDDEELDRLSYGGSRHVKAPVVMNQQEIQRRNRRP